MVPDHETTINDRPSRLQRSGSLSSLNDESHSNDMSKRKMTILEMAPAPRPTIDDNNPLKKLNDDLIRIAIHFINDRLNHFILPQTMFVCLPRDVRRHHTNGSWLADDKILFQIKSYDFNQIHKAKEFLITLNQDFDETFKTRYRRFTDGNRQNFTKRKDRTTVSTESQDDLHLRSLGLISFHCIRVIQIESFRFRHKSIDLLRTKSLDSSDKSNFN